MVAIDQYGPTQTKIQSKIQRIQIVLNVMVVVLLSWVCCIPRKGKNGGYADFTIPRQASLAGDGEIGITTNSLGSLAQYTLGEG